ncbi:MAG: hypothetical protein AB7U85_02475 [Alphaproteobacteria bacterium]
MIEYGFDNSYVYSEKKSNITDKKVADFKAKGPLKAFACGVAKTIKEMSPESRALCKAASGYLIAAGSAIASVATSNPLCLSGAAIGGLMAMDGTIESLSEKGILSSVKSGINNIIAKGREAR